MRCIKCETEIESDDNFCPKCGHWTPNGYTFLKDDSNLKMIENGETVKQSNRLLLLGSLLVFLFILFVVMYLIRGDNLFKPFSYLKKQSFNYIYGYNTSLIKNDNKYNNQEINNYNDAINFIKKDFNSQRWQCFNSIEVNQISYKIEQTYAIPSVTFCDLSSSTAKEIENVIDRMYELFPNIKGALTNITITNASSKSEYIAYFQPMYQFVNIDENIESYNKVNKTQVLLNSYYFLNDDIKNKSLNDILGNNLYIKDATITSTIAHEFGHYISFVTLLKENNVDNITFVTASNKSKIDNIINLFNSGEYSLSILKEALDNYNNKYNMSLTLEKFAANISKYAGSLDKNNNLIADETIAESIHDYYLHGSNMDNCSKEIINVINKKLVGAK